MYQRRIKKEKGKRMDYETIIYETPETGIGLLTLNRPKRYNSVDLQMMEELEDFWKERLYDLDTVVIVMRGSGTKGFCAGLDMKATKQFAPEMSIPEFYRFQARLARLGRPCWPGLPGWLP